MKRTWAIMVLGVGACLGVGCGASTRRAPTLESPVATTGPQAPEKRGILETAGDATWRVVTAPARLIPPKAAPKAEPEVSDPPAVTIIQRRYDDDVAPATTGPAHP